MSGGKLGFEDSAGYVIMIAGDDVGGALSGKPGKEIQSTGCAQETSDVWTVTLWMNEHV